MGGPPGTYHALPLQTFGQIGRVCITPGVTLTIMVLGARARQPPTRRRARDYRARSGSSADTCTT
jgi:hypothetical protein